ncbi:kelch-like ECH-associated protein 1B isoform X1 [Cloeon dipterum]|uniref:kelch-like ECH-associated protein 1B isoform X1 n=2 Tax=Cloeon dipterum TaxID=197152 RepID=UPI0032200B88
MCPSALKRKFRSSAYSRWPGDVSMEKSRPKSPGSEEARPPKVPKALPVLQPAELDTGVSSCIETNYCIPSYLSEAMQMMQMMRSHRMLTDVVLEVGQELIHSHKVVLAAASPYFKAMFTGGLREADMERVKLQGVCPTAMAALVRFMYTGTINVSELTVCQLLPAATMFQINYVIDACCSFLERQLDPSNAIGIASFAQQHSCDDLFWKSQHFIERYFTQVCQEEEFLQLSPAQLVNLIKRDGLNVQEEMQVYEAVMKWVRYDEETRSPKMENILSSVRCQFLTPTFLKQQMNNCDVLRRLPACREYLAKIFKDLTLHKAPCERERKPNTPRLIYIAGGYLRHSLDKMEAYNVDNQTWRELAKLPVPRSGLSGAFLKGVFYAVGGRNNSPGSHQDSDRVDKYCPGQNQWQQCAPLSVPRNRVGVAVMDCMVYAVGGSAGCDYHNSVERYDPEEDKWSQVAPMHQPRLGVGVAVVNRLLYAIGGYDGKDRLNTAEVYHPENNAWHMIAPMRTRRSGAGVVALGNKIYVVGGYDGNNQLETVECYDTETNTWEQVASMSEPRSALSVTTLDGKLYAMGGYGGQGQSFLSIVEVYYPELDQWQRGTELTCGRSGHASAVSYHQCLVHRDQQSTK